mmetsp:Transcript_27767/g.5084  ORF Transcript_27767/g.5084 Transcript_27767/m.5084 type:complete len:128 (+) Transcript_27767:307-690(+)
MIFGIISILSILYGLGTFVSFGIFLNFVSKQYEDNSAYKLIIINLIGTLLFYSAGVALHHGLNSGLISSILLLCSSLSFLFLVHGMLIVLKISSFEVSYEDIFPGEKNTAKVIILSTNLIFAYFICF